MTEQTVENLRKAKHGDKQAAEALIEENSGLIWSVARRFFGRGTEPDDLYQLGCVGFLKAIEGFDENFGTQFRRYPARYEDFCVMTAQSRSAAASKSRRSASGRCAPSLSSASVVSRSFRRLPPRPV